MGLRKYFIERGASLKAEADALNAVLRTGREPRDLSAVELAQGHSGVSVESSFERVAYGLRTGSLGGWCWLLFTCAHCGVLFHSLWQGSYKMNVNGRLVRPEFWWNALKLGLFYVPFFFVGFAFTVARYRVVLARAQVVVCWRILPYLGWTWTLPAGREVVVRLAYRGSTKNNRPVESVVVSSQGKEVAFGAFLKTEVKEYIAAAISRFHPSSIVTIPR